MKVGNLMVKLKSSGLKEIKRGLLDGRVVHHEGMCNGEYKKISHPLYSGAADSDGSVVFSRKQPP